MSLLSGQDLLEAAMERGLDEYSQGAIEDEVAALLGCQPDEPVVQRLTDLALRSYVEGYDRAEAQA